MNNKENTKFLLYKLEEIPKKLEREEVKQERKEKFIQKLFEENLTNIFSNLIFLASECQLEADIEGENHRLDTLAFDKKKEHFVIIEYKRGKASELASQIKSYLNCLEDIDNQYTLLRILSDKVKSKKWNRKEIEWDETKGVCIATEIDRRATWVDRERNMKIVKIEFYNKDVLYINIDGLPKWLTVATSSKSTEKNEQKSLEKKEKNEDNITSSALSIDDLLNEEWISSETKKMFQEINDFLAKKWLNWQISYIVYYHEKSSKRKLFTVVVKTRQINIYGNWPQEISQSLSELLSRYGIEYRTEDRNGTGNWHFLPVIKTNNDFQNLKNFLQEYKNNFSENSKIFK